MKELSVTLMTGDFEYPSKNNNILCGGLSGNLSWNEYIDLFTEDTQKRLLLIKNFIIDNHLLGMTGEWQNNKYFKFSDNIILSFTWRAWGDLMQAIINKREGYIKYYM